MPKFFGILILTPIRFDLAIKFGLVRHVGRGVFPEGLPHPVS